MKFTHRRLGPPKLHRFNSEVQPALHKYGCRHRLGGMIDNPVWHRDARAVPVQCGMSFRTHAPQCALGNAMRTGVAPGLACRYTVTHARACVLARVSSHIPSAFAAEAEAEAKAKAEVEAKPEPVDMLSRARAGIYANTQQRCSPGVRSGLLQGTFYNKKTKTSSKERELESAVSPRPLLADTACMQATARPREKHPIWTHLEVRCVQVEPKLHTLQKVCIFGCESMHF
jgi:hypothetical protein